MDINTWSTTRRIEVAVVAALAVVFTLVAVSSCQPPKPPPPALPDTSTQVDPPPPLDSPMEARFPSVYDREADIRVRLDRETRPPAIGTAQTLRLTAGADSVEVTGPVFARAEEGGLVLRHSESRTAAVALRAAPDSLVTISTIDSTPIALGQTRYPGELLLVPPADPTSGAIDVVLTLPIEAYVPRVLAAELYRTWPVGAYEAQAIAARSYALHERARSRARGRAWDVESTTADQAFADDRAHETARAGAANTRGLILRAPEGGVLRAYYSSTCGGRDASARDTFPTTEGFEYNRSAALDAAPREHLCQSAPRYTWRVTRNARTYARRLAAWGKAQGHPIKGLRTIAAITPERRNALDRPITYRVRDTTGEAFTIGAENLRVASNAPTRGIARPASRSRVHSNDMQHRLRGNSIEITGRGFGHGVGLCQYDARAFAERGDSPRDMLAAFYPGAVVVTAYPAATPADR